MMNVHTPEGYATEAPANLPITQLTHLGPAPPLLRRHRRFLLSESKTVAKQRGFREWYGQFRELHVVF